MSPATGGKSSYCHLCGARLVARYARYENGLVACEQCEATAPRCIRCHIPLVAAASQPQPLCEACRQEVPWCAACGDPIVAAIFSLTDPLSGDSRTFCERCMLRANRCDLCAAPVPPAARKIKDGQWRCTGCARDMVLDPHLVAQIYSKALAHFEAVLPGGLSVLPKLRIAGHVALERMRHEHELTPPVENGVTTHTLGYFLSADGASTIFVRLGLPQTLLLGTIAHELGHAWQVEHARGLREPTLIEGFAEWVAYHILLAAGQREAAARATRREDVYGEGLRACLAIERSVGRPAMLRQLQRARGKIA